VKVMHLLGRPT